MPGPLAPGSPIRTFLGYGLAAIPLSLLAIGVFGALFEPKPPAAPVSPELKQWREAQMDEQQRQAVRVAERKQHLCRQQTLCRKFGEVRQACATAGDYKKCVDIKMGATSWTYTRA